MLSRSKLGYVSLWALLACGAPAAPCQSQSDTSCGQSTVEEAGGPEFASRAKSFLAKLQAAVEKNDKTRFASLVQYPVRMLSGSRRTKISTRAELIKRYQSIVTADIRKAVLDQSPACLFGNYQGVMVGRGQIWFAEQSDGHMKIITINTDVPN